MQIIERWLFGTFVALVAAVSGLIVILIARSLGAKSFEAIWVRGAALMDKAGPFEWVLFALVFGLSILLFFAGAYLATKSRWLFNVVSGNGLHPSTLNVLFSANVGGCRATTTLTDGREVDFYRLWVRPSPRLNNVRCTGTLVDIMEPTPGLPGVWHSFWNPERLQLAWATHTKEPQLQVDLRDRHGMFLDVLAIDDFGRVAIGTPGFTMPNALSALPFVQGNLYLFVVSLGCEGEEPIEVLLSLVWPDSRRNVDIRRME